MVVEPHLAKLVDQYGGVMHARLARRRRNRVVFPLPRNPVMMVIGRVVGRFIHLAHVQQAGG